MRQLEGRLPAQVTTAKWYGWEGLCSFQPPSDSCSRQRVDEMAVVLWGKLSPTLENTRRHVFPPVCRAGSVLIVHPCTGSNYCSENGSI